MPSYIIASEASFLVCSMAQILYHRVGRLYIYIESVVFRLKTKTFSVSQVFVNSLSRTILLRIPFQK